MGDIAKEINEVVEVMHGLDGEISDLEAKAETVEGEDAEKVTGELEAKSAEWEAEKAKLERLKAKRDRQAEMAKVKSRAGELEEVEVPKSEHNETNWQRERDFAAKTYLIEGKDAFGLLARDNEQVCDSVRSKHKDGGVHAPSYIADHILSNRFVGKNLMLQAKGANDVLTTDASGTNSGGGSLVPDTFIPELFKIPQIETRLMDRCRVKRAVSGTAEFPRLTQSTNRFGVAVSWGTEGSSITEDNPVFTQVEVSTNRLTGLSQVSLKELRTNGVGLEAEMATMFRGAFNSAVSQAILQGGSNRPQGINTNTSIAAGVNVVNRTTASQVSYEDLVELQYTVATGVMPTSIWVVSAGASGAMKYIAGLTDSENRPLLTNLGSWENSTMIPTLIGSEYIYTPDNTSNLGYRGDVIFGDFSCYGVAVDQEVTIDRSDQYAFDKGLVTYRVMGYVGGKPLGEDCFALLGDPSAASSSSSSSST
jgi:HK97 family phage major capsid protein